MPSQYFEVLSDEIGALPVPTDATDDTFTVQLDGPGGGHWTLGVVDGVFSVVEEVRGPELARVTLSVADWREIAVGRVRDAIAEAIGTPNLSPGLLAKLQEAPRRLEPLRSVNGAIQVAIEDDEEDATYTLTLRLGSQLTSTDAPATTISLGLAQAVDLIGKRENIQSAFFSGSIRLDGDMNLAMSIITSLA
jgi:hypothetical protein